MKHVLVDGYEMPEGTRSDHQRFAVPSEEMRVLKGVLLDTLSVFHEFSNKWRIGYSLSGGSLIGCYCGSDMIPWDDDIDVEIHPSGVPPLLGLWESGTATQNIQRYSRGFNNRHTRIVELSGRSFEIIVNTPAFRDGKPWLMKLRPVDHNCFHNVPGGFDITTVFDVNGTILNGWDVRTLGVDPRHMNDVDSPLVWFGGVRTRALTPERGTPYLLSKYGDQWAVKQHPSIKLPPTPRSALAACRDTTAS